MSSIFRTEPFQKGYTWTIISKLGHILESAEKKFGERDKSYTILGVEITNQSRPQIWYPGNSKNIIIQITDNCLFDLNRAVFQVAHESVHCLCPTEGNHTNVLEEGLANLFSIEYCKLNGHGDKWSANEIDYTNASENVSKFLRYDSDIIKKLRAIEPKISMINKDLIKKVNSSIPESLIDNLTKKFNRF